MNPQTDLPSVLAHTRLFASLNAEALRLLASICTHRQYDARQHLFAEGDLGNEMFIVLSLERYGPIGLQLMLVEAGWQALVNK